MILHGEVETEVNCAFYNLSFVYKSCNDRLVNLFYCFLFIDYWLILKKRMNIFYNVCPQDLLYISYISQLYFFIVIFFFFTITSVARSIGQICFDFLKSDQKFKKCVYCLILINSSFTNNVQIKIWNIWNSF